MTLLLTKAQVAEAFQNLSDEDDDRVYAMALRRCNGNQAEARDLQGETYVAMLEMRFPWKADRPLWTQAFSVMRRLLSKQLRKAAEKNKVPLAEAEQLADPSVPAEGSLTEREADRVYTEIRDAFPEGSFVRRVWELAYCEEVLDLQEQMDLLGETDRRRVENARERIRQQAREVLPKYGLDYPRKKKT